MKRMTMQEAIVAAIAGEMRRDRDVFIMGLDIGRFGGPLNSCKGLWDEFGASGRVIDTPISEGAIVGAGVGGAAGSVVGASVTERPKTRVVREHTHSREVVHVERRPGKRRGHHKHPRRHHD